MGMQKCQLFVCRWVRRFIIDKEFYFVYSHLDFLNHPTEPKRQEIITYAIYIYIYIYIYTYIMYLCFYVRTYYFDEANTQVILHFGRLRSYQHVIGIITGHDSHIFEESRE